MKVSLLICLLLAGGISAQTSEQDEASRAYHKEYLAAVDKMEAKFPDLIEDRSTFTILLDHRISLAQIRKDPALADPNFILKWADEIAAELEAVGQPVTKPADANSAPKATTPATTPAPASRQVRVLTHAEEAQAYLDKVARGEAGVDPKLQTLARSGDVYAQQEIERRRALQRVTAAVNAGSMSADVAAAERATIDQRHAQAVQQLQLDELIEEQERLKWSLQKLQQEQERRRRHR
jgi:hypothetical protein